MHSVHQQTRNHRSFFDASLSSAQSYIVISAIQSTTANLSYCEACQGCNWEKQSGYSLIGRSKLLKNDQNI